MQRSFGSFEKNGRPTLKIGIFFWTFEGELKVVVNFLFKKICQHYLVEINQMLSFKKNSAICLCGYQNISRILTSWQVRSGSGKGPASEKGPDPEKVRLRSRCYAVCNRMLPADSWIGRSNLYHHCCSSNYSLFITIWSQWTMLQ